MRTKKKQEQIGDKNETRTKQKQEPREIRN